jgi:hypothetical protein
MSAPKLRTMRARDMVKHSRFIIPRFAGVVAELDGREIGAASIVIGDGQRPFLSMEMTDEILRKFPIFMHRTARMITEVGLSQLGELYAIESSREPGAGRWLRRLGFVPTEEFIGGERIYAHGTCSGGNRLSR